MYNVSTEQIIKVKAPKNALIFKIIMIIACILAVTTIPQTHAFGLLLFAVLVVFTVFVFRYYNAEYEYSLVDGELTVDRIMARTIRHLFGNMTVFVLFPAIPIIIKRLAVSTICMSPLTTYHQKESFQTL